MVQSRVKVTFPDSCLQIKPPLKIELARLNEWPISSPLGFGDMRCMLAVTPSASSEPHRSNPGMIYVPCPSLHATCSPAPELLAALNSSSNLSPYVRRRWGPKVREMKMTRPDLIVVSICGSRQDVCLNVHLSICPSVSLPSRRRVFVCVGRDAVAAVSHYRCWSDPGGGFAEEICPTEMVSLSQHSLMEAIAPVSLLLIYGFADFWSRSVWNCHQVFPVSPRTCWRYNKDASSGGTLWHLFAFSFLTSPAHLTRLSQQIVERNASCVWLHLSCIIREFCSVYTHDDLWPLVWQLWAGVARHPNVLSRLCCLVSAAGSSVWDWLFFLKAFDLRDLSAVSSFLPENLSFGPQFPCKWMFQA